MVAAGVSTYVSGLATPYSAYAARLAAQNKREYSIVYSSVFSPDGRVLALADSEGWVWVLNLHTQETDALVKQERGQWAYFKAHPGAIYSLHFLPDSSLLLSGGQSDIRAWSIQNLSDLSPGQNTISPVGVMRAFPSGPFAAVGETNAICTLPNAPNVVCTGSGDGAVYLWDINTALTDLSGLGVSAPLGVLKGHTDMVLALCPAGDRVVSGSEDATARLWDVRSQKGTGSISFPAERGHQVAGASYVSCVASESDGSWLVCGGGGRVGLRMFHTSSLNESKRFAVKQIPQTLLFHNKHLWVGGQGPSIQVFSHATAICSLETSARSVFSLAPCPATAPAPWREGVVCAVGTGRAVDVFAEESHRAMSIPLLECN